MKLCILYLTLILGFVSTISYANSSTDTVKSIKLKSDKEPIILSGTIIKSLGNKEFIIEDKTGKIKIELNFETDIENDDFFSKYPYLVGAIVVIEATTDKELLKQTTLEVTRIEVITAPSLDPFINAINGDFSEVLTIKAAKKLNNKDQVILSGTVLKMSNNHTLLLKDDEGSEIVVEINFKVHNARDSFLKENPDIVDSHIILQGFLDKPFLEKVSIKANRIHVLNTPSEDPFVDAVNKAKSIYKGEELYNEEEEYQEEQELSE